MPTTVARKPQTSIPSAESTATTTAACGRIMTLVCFFVPSALALALALLHNFTWNDIRITLSTDGKHYLITIQKFVEAISSGNFAAIWGNAGAAAHMLLDGPLLALIYVPVFLMAGHVPTPRDWNILADGQSLIHAGTAGLASLLVLRVTRNPAWAIMAGLLFAAYPSAVLQTGHLMTETPAALLCLLLVWALSSLKRPIAGPLVGGLVAGLLIVSKPALIPAVVVASFFGCMQFASRKKAFVGFLAALLAVALPWCAITNEVTGKPSITAQRQPVYNVAKAWNPEFDGWGCNPHPVLTDLNGETEGPLNVVYAMWHCYPQECATLVSRKITRLFAYPWNDFKNRAVGVDMNGQIYWHQMLLCAGIYGMILFACCRYRQMSSATRLPLELCAILVSGHFAYILAESTARYAFTAMPLLMVLAVFGLASSGRGELSKSPGEAPRIAGVLGSLIAAMALTSLIMHSEKLTRRDDPKNLREMSHAMTFGQRAEKVIDFTEVKAPATPASVLVLVDGDKNLEQCEVVVNGKKAEGHPLSVSNIDGPHYELYNQMREFAPSMGVNSEDFRQWRFVRVSPDWIDWHGPNKIELSVKAPAATVYGDGNIDSRYMLSPDYFSYGLVSSASPAAGAESRLPDPVITGDARRSSRILSGSRAERLFDSLRIRLACVMPAPASSVTEVSKPSGTPSSPTNDSQPFQAEFSPSTFDPMLQEGDQVRMNKTVLYAARSVGASVKLPSAPAGKSHLKFTFTGEIKALRNPGNAGVLLALAGKHGEVAIPGRLPRAVNATAEWAPFVISDEVPLSVVGSSLDSLAVALYPVPWMEGQYGAPRKAPDVALRNLKVHGHFTDLPAMAGAKVIYY
ncbi:MAG: hypothetical protein K2W95_10355 [Candidatus Obscuribacterales bacterium]|nr:hypothetical protein [Candidatus Obscuribacterales bacterium]